MHGVADLIHHVGGPCPLFQEIGVSRSHARRMKARRSILPAFWPRIVAAAGRRGIEGVSFEALTRMRLARRADAA